MSQPLHRLLPIYILFFAFTSVTAQNLEVQIQATGPSCSGSSDAQLTAQPSGGLPPFTYLWNDGSTSQSLNNMPAGSYSVIVRDLNNDTALDTVTLNDPTPITWVVATNYATCDGSSDATASVVSTQGGMPPYSYEWSTGDTTPTVNNLSVGNYILSISDALGCEYVDNIEIEVSPEGIWLMPEATDALCVGGSTGSIYAGVMTGTPPFTYAWSDPSFPNSATVNNVAPGTYQVTVTDANGCTGSEEATVGEPPLPLGVELTANSIDCTSGLMGSVVASADGGTPAYSYLWNTGDTTAVIDNLMPGSYSVTVTDANGCEEDSQTPIFAPDPILLSLSTKLETCPGSEDGAVFVDSVMGGSSPYTYQWLGLPDTTPLLNNVAADDYTVIVTDAIGCTGQATTTVENSPEGLWVMSDITPISCPQGFDGAIDATPMNGTPPYSYEWSPAFLDDTSFVSGLSPGTYFVTVTDDNGCTGVDTAQLVAPAQIVIELTVTDPDCISGAAGSISSSVSGGTLPYTYLWSNDSTGANITNIAPGPYTLTVTDANGCTSTATAVVNAISDLIWTTFSQPITCEKACNGIVGIDNISGGTPPYTFDWNTGDTTQFVDSLCGGDYFVIIEDQNGCFGIAYITVDTSQLMIDVQISNPLCAGDNDGQIVVTPLNGDSPYIYRWDDPTVDDEAIITDLMSGTYRVTVTDANECTATATSTVVEPPVLNLMLEGLDDDCKNGLNGSVEANVTGGTSPYNYRWDTNPVVTTQIIENLGAGTYCVTVTDDNDCTIEGCITIEGDNPDAGTITADADNVCLSDGSADLSATPDGNDIVPPGYQTIYVLTQGAGLVIVQTNLTPDFTVTSGGLYTIHTLVYDPNTLDLSVIVPGTTTAADVLNLIEPIGDICADLDAVGAPINVDNPDAGTITADADNVCLSDGSADLSATPDGNDIVPPGYQTIYVLTQGAGLVIVQTNLTPDFTVTSGGLYTIHTLVYDPNTLDLSVIVPGTTTAADVLNLIEPIGDICADLDAVGAPINVDNPDAGTITADADNVCLSDGSADLSATPDGNDIVPPGYQTIYVLTQGAGLVIVQTNNTPEFTVTSGGLYTIHTLVYDPNTLDLSVIVPGTTTAADVLNLIEPIGDICADLDAVGAPINVDNPDAGTITADADNVCLSDGSADLSATPDGNDIVPPGYQTIYVLTQGAGLVIVQTNLTPEFTVTSGGLYTIHTLVYDPNTLDLSVIVPGTTTAADVLNLIEPIGDICADLDAVGAPINVDNPDAGTITADADNVCLSDGSADLSATPDGNDIVPPGYQTIYVLTQGAGLVIVQTNLTPDFTVTSGGLYTIHTLVYDPNTLDLSVIVPGTTTAADVLNLIEPIGDICADLDAVGAPINVDNPDAGTITADADNVCLSDGSADLSATPDGNDIVPPGYQTIYVLTQGAGLVIVQTNLTPDFTVTSGGLYTIHTLVYDPNTLDLSVIVPGTTTAADVLNLIEPIGDICADLDAVGAPINVDNPDAGTITADADNVCLSDGSADLSATPDGNDIVPPGYQTIYVLTQGAGLVIVQTNNTPEFTVTSGGLYTIHTLVYDPNTLDLSVIVPGTTTAADVLNLIEPIGDICADLDAVGAPISVDEPEAGTLTAVANNVCLENGSADVEATPDGNANIPAGYQRVYLLSSGAGAIIRQRSNAPSFTVTTIATYKVHTFIYNPSTFNINTIVLGSTRINDIINLISPVGDICADLDVSGATVVVEDCGDCINVGDYVWFDLDRDGIQDSNEDGIRNFEVWLTQEGNDGVFGTPDDEVVDIDVTNLVGYYLFECVPSGIYRIVFPSYQLGTDEVFTTPNAGGNDELDSDANPSTGATIPFAVTPSQVDDDLSWDAGIYDLCIDVTYGGEICCDQTICEGEIPNLITEVVPVAGGLPGIQYIWMFTTDPISNAVINWTPIPGTNSPNYQPDALFTTTSFIRCVRNQGCSVFVKESNAVTITVIPGDEPQCVGTLMEMVATPMDDMVDVSWTANAEKPGMQYVVEYSPNGNDFTEIAEIPAYANGSSNSYSFMHADANSGMNYYRIRMEMYGHFLNYSDTEMVILRKGMDSDFFIYPNPFSHEFTINSIGKMMFSGDLNVYSAAGQLMKQYTFNSGEQLSHVVDMRNAAGGVYYIRIIYHNSERSVEVFKMTKL